MEENFGWRTAVQVSKTGDEIGVQRRMSVAPQCEVAAFEDGRQIHREQRIVKNIQRDVEILRVIEVECLANKREMQNDGQQSEDDQIALHTTGSARGGLRPRVFRDFRKRVVIQRSCTSLISKAVDKVQTNDIAVRQRIKRNGNEDIVTFHNQLVQ